VRSRSQKTLPTEPPERVSGVGTILATSFPVMNVRLAIACFGLWALGMIGMGVSRWLLDQGPGAACFDACAGLWAVGGTTYCLLGVLALSERSQAS